MEETPRGTKRKSTHSDKDKSKKRSKHTEESAIDGKGEQSNVNGVHGVNGQAVNGHAPNATPKKSKKAKKSRSQNDGDEAGNKLPRSSPFAHIHASMYATISPILQGDATQAVCANQLSPLIGLYYPSFKGTILSYKNIQFPGQDGAEDDGEEPYVLAKSVNEYALPQIWISAEFLVFQPKPGSAMEGFVNVQEESFVNLVVYNWFSASISRRRLPKDWKWVEEDGMEVDVENDMGEDGDEEQDDDEITAIPSKRKKRRGEGHWEDANGTDIAELGAIEFRVVDVTPPFARDDRDRQIMSITGTMLSAAEEQELMDMGGSRAPSMAARASRSVAPMPKGILKHSRSDS